MDYSFRREEGKPWMSSGNAMYREPADRCPTDLFSYTRQSHHCLEGGRYLAAIAMASIAVELILNRDRRLRSLPNFGQGRHAWENLNNTTLRLAREQGLPTDALLSDGDNLDAKEPIAFVELRNKVAHGEITHLFNTLSDYDPGAAKLAAGQEEKMRAFVSEWLNTAPDVQEGHTKDNRWPDLP